MLRANIAEVFIKVDRSSHGNTLQIEFTDEDRNSPDDARWWAKITKRAIDELKNTVHLVDRENYREYRKRQPHEDAYGGLFEVMRHWIKMCIKSWDLSRNNTLYILADLGKQIKAVEKDPNSTMSGETLIAMRNLHQFMGAEFRASVHFETTSFDFRRFEERFMETADEDKESQLGEADGLSDTSRRSADVKIVTAPTSLNAVSQHVYVGPDISNHKGGAISWVAEMARREMEYEEKSHSSGLGSSFSDSDTCSVFTSESEQSLPEDCKSFKSWGSSPSVVRLRAAFEKVMDEAAKQVERVIRRIKRAERDGSAEPAPPPTKCPLQLAGMASSCYDCIAGPGVFPCQQTKPSESLLKLIPDMKCFPCDLCWDRQLHEMQAKPGAPLSREDWERVGAYRNWYRRPPAKQPPPDSPRKPTTDRSGSDQSTTDSRGDSDEGRSSGCPSPGCE